jgi:hypothetical protein
MSICNALQLRIADKKMQSSMRIARRVWLGIVCLRTTPAADRGSPISDNYFFCYAGKVGMIFSNEINAVWRDNAR